MNAVALPMAIVIVAGIWFCVGWSVRGYYDNYFVKNSPEKKKERSIASP